MRYLSPSFLFGEALEYPIPRKIIQQKRRVLLTELELNGGERLEVAGELLSKSDIINYFEELLHEPIVYHKAIGKDTVLINFLQDGRLDEGEKFSDAADYDNPDLVAWISPYFYSAFTRFVAACFELTDETSMAALMANRLLMTESDTERAWGFVSNILIRNIAFFEHYKGKAKKNSPKPMPIGNVIDYIGYGYIQVIKQLPNSRFAQLKDVYAFNMQHPAICTFNRDRDNRTLAVTWVENAKSLAVSEDLKAEISKKAEELNGILNRIKNTRAPWYVVWLFFIAIKGLVSVFDSSSSEPKLQHIPPYFKASDTTRKPDKDSLFLDSIIRQSRSIHS